MQRWVSAVLIALFLPLLAQASDVGSYPDKPIRIVVPYLPGGAADVLARRVGERLTERLKQPVVIDNKPGGNTLIGSEAVMNAPADGYTLFATNTTIVQIPFLYPVRYDATRDFRPVNELAGSPLVLAVLSSVPANNVQEFVAYLKTRPGKTTYGTSGVGGTQHIFSEAFKRATGTDSVHVPYKGEPPLVTDFLAGRVDWFISTQLTVLPYVKTGKVKLLAATGDKRLPLLPDVPTFKEEGIPSLGIVGWYALFAPAATPDPIVERLSNEVHAIIRTPEISQFLKDNGLIPSGTVAAEFAPQVKEAQAAFGRMIKENDIRVDQ
ncbi:MAG: tripartite tricarboxylate transporter substrate binding protein [Burkholderiaceae bacterium]